MEYLSIIEKILRNREEFFAAMRDGVNMPKLIRAMLFSSFTFLAMYGTVMGLSHGLLQAITSLFKLPVLFLATLLICVPSLHFFNILFGSKQTALQSIALSLTAISTTSVLLFSLSPITLFFLITSDSYPFFKLLNVAFFTIAGWTGLAFLRQGMKVVTEEGNPEGLGARRLIFLVWVFLYGFVGTQMAWTLSPFMGDPTQPYMLLQQPGGNFYADVFNALIMLFRS
jgi:hypothetical protein